MSYSSGLGEGHFLNAELPLQGMGHLLANLLFLIARSEALSQRPASGVVIKKYANQYKSITQNMETHRRTDMTGLHP